MLKIGGHFVITIKLTACKVGVLLLLLCVLCVLYVLCVLCVLCVCACCACCACLRVIFFVRWNRCPCFLSICVAF